MNAGTLVGVNVQAAYNADMSAVDVTVDISPQVTMTGTSLGVVLTADSLAGASNAWKQSNYYYQYQPSQLPDDMAMFCAGGSKGQSSITWVYNDVAIASYDSDGNYVIEIGGLAKYERKAITTSIPMPTKQVIKNAIIPHLVAANAFLIGNDKKIINGARAYVDMLEGVRELRDVSPANAREVARYSLDGRMLVSPQKGINIIRLSDGTTRKVMVK